MNILGIKKDIEKSFRRQSVLTIVAVGGAFIFALVVSLWALSFAEKQRQKIYVLDQGKSLLLALQTDAILSKDVEIRDSRPSRRIWTGPSIWPTAAHSTIRRTWPRRAITAASYRPTSASR